MLKVRMLIGFLIAFIFEAQASGFSHLKLNPQFEEFITRSNLTQGPRHSILSESSLEKFEDTKAADQALRATFLQAVFGQEKRAEEGVSSYSSIENDSPLYAEIRRHLEDNHQQIGRSQVDQINLINEQFNLGNQNFSGFSWQKPFGAIQVYADRQVTPNLFGDNWLIQDSFVFEIEASTFLDRLNDAGLLNMALSDIAAFAGLSFKRSYTTYHYANSYQEGLTSNFSKLFLPFIEFNPAGLEKLGNEEIIKREDNWTVNTGGLISSPSYYGVSAGGGILAEIAYQRTVTAQSTFTQQPKDERFRIGVKGEKQASSGATMALELDFFKLIKLALLKADMNYDYDNSSEFQLSFTDDNWNQVQLDPVKNKEIKDIFKGQGKTEVLEQYVLNLDETDSSAIENQGNILIWGKLQKTKTEHVRVIKDGQVRLFFKNYNQSVKVVQNILSKIFTAIVYKLFKFPFASSNAATYSRQLVTEYEATHAQSQDPQIARIENTSQFSLTIIQSYDAAQTHRSIDKKIKNDILWFIDSFTTLPPVFHAEIDSDNLRGPIHVESNLRVEKTGLDFFLNTPDDKLWEKIALVCKSKHVQEWQVSSTRLKLLNKILLGPDNCVKKMGKKFTDFKADFLSNSQMPSTKKFKDFLSAFYKKSESIQDLMALFGKENTFVNGRLQATTSTGTSFVTSFSAGQFRGLGVIDNLKRSTGSRTPASIVSE